MRLATLRTGQTTRAVRVDAARGAAIEIGEFADVGALLQHPDWAAVAAEADGLSHSLETIGATAYAPVVPNPSKIICVGLNYGAHIQEMGRPLPEHPTLFAKFAEALVGAGDDVLIPRHAGGSVDWEGELAVVVGRSLRHASKAAAAKAIAGYTIMNDVTVRGYQYRTTQWLQGKTFESSTPLGPVLVTPDDMPDSAQLTTMVSGVRRQRGSIDDLVFGPAEILAYISQILTLNPGDVVATGTPSGVGQASTPPDYLADGEQVVVSIEGIGALRNRLKIVDPVSSAR